MHELYVPETINSYFWTAESLFFLLFALKLKNENSAAARALLISSSLVLLLVSLAMNLLYHGGFGTLPDNLYDSTAPNLPVKIINASCIIYMPIFVMQIIAFTLLIRQQSKRIQEQIASPQHDQ